MLKQVLRELNIISGLSLLKVIYIRLILPVLYLDLFVMLMGCQHTCNSVLSYSELMVHSDVAKDVLHNIIQLYVKLHSFFFCKGHYWKHKMKLKELKSKTLQKDIGRASKEIMTKTGIIKLNQHVILAIHLWHKKHAFSVFFYCCCICCNVVLHKCEPNMNTSKQ